MRDLDCLNMAETAETLAISKVAVKSTDFRARKRLAYALTPPAKGKEMNVY
jgi:DNA-directed RNA polymerase specialized sigma24 family protein